MIGGEQRATDNYLQVEVEYRYSSLQGFNKNELALMSVQRLQYYSPDSNVEAKAICTAPTCFVHCVQVDGGTYEPSASTRPSGGQRTPPVVAVARRRPTRTVKPNGRAHSPLTVCRVRATKRLWETQNGGTRNSDRG